jgi:hypothetical protein
MPPNGETLRGNRLAIPYPFDEAVPYDDVLVLTNHGICYSLTVAGALCNRRLRHAFGDMLFK